MKAFSNRYELKYVLDWQTYFRIQKEIQVLFKRDPTSGKNGKYEVMSVYYDTPTLDFFWEKMDGEEQRIKIRLRTYEHHEELASEKKKKDVFLEIKQKKNKNIYKRRILIDEKTAHAFLTRPLERRIFINELDSSARALRTEIECLRSFLRLKPTLVTAYTREPWVSADNLNTRITFDSNIRYRHREFSLAQHCMDKHILSPIHVVMEIKYTDYFPQWLVQLIQKYRCEARTFSKYGIGMEHVLGEQQMFTAV